MIHRFRYFLLLLILYLLLLISGLLVLHNFQTDLAPGRYASLVTIMTLVTLGAYLLVRLGLRRDHKERGIFLLAALGGKFLSYLIIVLIFWAPAKNLSKDFFVAFFVLYLLLTFFLVGILYKTLKSN